MATYMVQASQMFCSKTLIIFTGIMASQPLARARQSDWCGYSPTMRHGVGARLMVERLLPSTGFLLAFCTAAWSVVFLPFVPFYLYRAGQAKARARAMKTGRTGRGLLRARARADWNLIEQTLRCRRETALRGEISIMSILRDMDGLRRRACHAGWACRCPCRNSRR